MPPAPPDRDAPDHEQPFISHLLELRDRILRMVAGIFVVFLVLFPFANDIYLYVAAPLMRHLPEGTSMIATGVATPFLTPFKLSLMAAVFLSMPYILYQFWGFVAPGLYRHEQRLVVPLLVSSTLLFYIGMAFAYYVVFPLVFAFFVGTTPDGVAVMTDISQYLDFVLTLFFAFGIAFEVPVATVLLVSMGMTTPDDLITKRPYIIVGAFVVGMVLTPPDVISQTLLAVPMWILFEAGVLASRAVMRQREERERAEEAAEGGYDPDSGPGGAAGDAGGGPSGREPPPPPPRPAPRPEPAPAPIGADIAGGDINEPGRFVPMTPEEMEQELDAIEAQLDRADSYESATPAEEPPAPAQDPIDLKLRRVQELRDNDDQAAARSLLYQVLEEGDADQRRVARNVLDQLDTP